MFTPTPIAIKNKRSSQLVSGFTPSFVESIELERRAGFTLMEVLVSAVLIAIVLVGLANLFVVGKRYILHNRSRMAGGELGRAFLDPLQMDITMTERALGAQNGWGQTNNCLTNPPNGCPGSQTLGIPYTPSYTISEVDMGGGLGAPNNLRRVKLDIGWNEYPP